MIKKLHLLLCIFYFLFLFEPIKAQSDSLQIKINQLITNANQFKNNNPIQALEFLNEAEKLIENTTSNKFTSIIFKEQGYIYLFSGNYKQAEEKFNKAIAFGSAQNDEINIAESNLGLGNIYYTLGNLPLAINFYLQALKTFEKINDPNGLNSAYTALADLYYRQNNFSKATEYQLKAIKIFEGKNDKLRKLTSYENLGNLYYRQNKLRDAETYYNKALQLFKEIDNKAGESNMLQKLGDIKMQLNELVKAIDFYNKSLAIAKQFNAKPLLVQNLIDLGVCYYKLEDYTEAEKHYKDAINYARQSQMNLELEEAYEGISLVYAAINNKKNAIAFSNLSKSIKDSLFNDSALKTIANLQLQYEFEKKHNQLELLKKTEEINQLNLQKQRQINTYLYVVILLLVLLVLGIIFYGLQKSKINKQLQMQYLALQDSNKKIIQQKEELTQLNNVKDRFFTIISHDLRNNLATMKMYFDTIEGKNISATPEHIQLTKQISESVQNTIDLLENLLVWASNQIKGIPLKIEKLNMYDLVEENINLVNASAIAKEIIIINDLEPNDVAMGDKNTVNLIIRNLLSNAIKFTPHGGEIAVTAVAKDNYLNISIADNGVGISQEKLPFLFTQYTQTQTKGTANEKGTGLGLMLCKEFVEKNNGTIQVNSQVGKGSVFTFTLRLP
ncbi:MAG: tetratricopeptide repeat protein [Bacteroidia bacterium]